MSCPVLPWLWSTQRTANTTHLRHPAPQLLWQASQPNICQPEHCGDGGSGGANAGERGEEKWQSVTWSLGLKKNPSSFCHSTSDINILIFLISIIWQSAGLKKFSDNQTDCGHTINKTDAMLKYTWAKCKCLVVNPSNRGLAVKQGC